jgi:hypothetical protein
MNFSAKRINNDARSGLALQTPPRRAERENREAQFCIASPRRGVYVAADGMAHEFPKSHTQRRQSMFSRIGVSVLFVVALVFGGQALAQQANPPVPATGQMRPLQVTPLYKQPGTVNILFLKSWECIGGQTLWDDLKTNWPNFGSIPISIDDTTFICNDFTLQDIMNAAPNVLVLSDPSGGLEQYSTAEIQAVEQYAKAGHVVVGTYLVFEYGNENNTGLAPVFGFQSNISYTLNPITNDFTKHDSSSCLMTGIPGSSWMSQGFAESQVPSTAGKWTRAVVNKMKPTPNLVAFETDDLALVTSRQKGGFASVFISNFPEYSGGTDDEQLLYNAVTCFVAQ